MVQTSGKNGPEQDEPPVQDAPTLALARKARAKTATFELCAPICTAARRRRASAPSKRRPLPIHRIEDGVTSLRLALRKSFCMVAPQGRFPQAAHRPPRRRHIRLR